MADSTAKTIWVTTAGDLGTVPENEFYQLTLEAIDDVTQTDADLKFRVIAGSLPIGVQVTTQGVLAGVPRGSLSVQGVPQEVDDNTKSESKSEAKDTGGVSDSDKAAWIARHNKRASRGGNSTAAKLKEAGFKPEKLWELQKKQREKKATKLKIKQDKNKKNGG